MGSPVVVGLQAARYHSLSDWTGAALFMAQRGASWQNVAHGHAIVTKLELRIIPVYCDCGSSVHGGIGHG
jgi:hypothetical protein